MFHNDLQKLSVTLVLLVAAAFVNVAAVAADDNGTKWLVKPASAPSALGGTADDWYGQSLGPARAGSAAVASDWFERHPDAIKASDAVFASDWFERHPDSIYSGGLSGVQIRYGPPGR